jgi:8-oxo-dGTP diphosphatase
LGAEAVGEGGDLPDFRHPYVAVDLVLLQVRGGRLHLLVLQRSDLQPRGWVLPGAYVQWEETVEQTAARVFRDKLGLSPVSALFPLRPFSGLDRDPRRRAISLPQLAFLAQEVASEGSADDLAWAEVSPSRPPEASVRGDRIQLAFDHEDILAEAIKTLRRRTLLGDPDLFRAVLPGEFTLRRLQEVHEALLGDRVNRDSFRRRLLASGRIEDTGRREADVGHRPARLFRWCEAVA